ncbi:MAG: site-specific integrase [Dehalococcoidia bacterium]
MRGHVRQRGQTWAAVVDVGRDESGKRKQRWYSGFRTKREAEKKLREVLTSLDEAAYIPPSRETVGHFLDRWLEATAGTIAETTHDSYTFYVQRHLVPAIGPVELAKLTPGHLQHLYSVKLRSGRLDGKGGLSPRSVRHLHVTLHTALAAAARWQVVSRNVADLVDAPKIIARDMSTFSEHGIREFLEAVDGTEWYVPFYLALFTGMRRSELLALRWSDVDLDRGHAAVKRTVHRLRNGSIVFRGPKSAKGRRTIALPPSTVVLLREHQEKQRARRVFLQSPSLSESDLVFSRMDGSPIPPDSLSQAWRRLTRQHGFGGIRLHDARHTHASLLLKAGTHPKVVQERLGHSTIGITLDLYSHVVPGLQEAAALAFDAQLGQTDLHKGDQPGRIAFANRLHET